MSHQEIELYHGSHEHRDKDKSDSPLDGFPVQDITDRLVEEDISVSQAALYMLLKKYMYNDSRTVAEELHGCEFYKKNTTGLLMIRWQRIWI